MSLQKKIIAEANGYWTWTTLSTSDLNGYDFSVRQVVVGRMARSGNLGGEMVNKLVQNARHVGSIPAAGAICPMNVLGILTTLCIASPDSSKNKCRVVVYVGRTKWSSSAAALATLE